MGQHERDIAVRQDLVARGVHGQLGAYAETGFDGPSDSVDGGLKVWWDDYREITDDGAEVLIATGDYSVRLFRTPDGACAMGTTLSDHTAEEAVSHHGDLVVERVLQHEGL